MANEHYDHKHEYGRALFPPKFLPTILTSSDRIGLPLSGIATDLMVPFLREGQTGFVTPELRKGKNHA